jgi:hypothetical protein
MLWPLRRAREITSMKKTILWAMLFTEFSISLLTAQRSAITAPQRLELLPLPPGVAVDHNADLTKEPFFAFSKKHSDLSIMDPFDLMVDKQHKTIPDIVSLRFTTSSDPREVYLFFKRFFNTESRKLDSKRKLPYYGSQCTQAFDQKNEGDVPSDLSEGDAAFYRMNFGGENGENLMIVIFNDGKSISTTTYVYSYTSKN